MGQSKLLSDWPLAEYLTSQSDANRWLDLGLNTAFTVRETAVLSVARANGISVIQNAAVAILSGTGAETVGLLTCDETGTFAAGRLRSNQHHAEQHSGRSVLVDKQHLELHYLRRAQWPASVARYQVFLHLRSRLPTVRRGTSMRQALICIGLPEPSGLVPLVPTSSWASRTRRLIRSRGAATMAT